MVEQRQALSIAALACAGIVVAAERRCVAAERAAAGRLHAPLSIQTTRLLPGRENGQQGNHQQHEAGAESESLHGSYSSCYQTDCIPAAAVRMRE